MARQNKQEEKYRIHYLNDKECEVHFLHMGKVTGTKFMKVEDLYLLEG